MRKYQLKSSHTVCILLIFSSGGGGGLVTKSCLTLATPWTVCSLPGSSVHGIFQARILEWVAISLSNILQQLILITFYIFKMIILLSALIYITSSIHSNSIYSHFTHKEMVDKSLNEFPNFINLNLDDLPQYSIISDTGHIYAL